MSLREPAVVEISPHDKPKTFRHVEWQLEQEQPLRLRYSRLSKVIDTVTASLHDDPHTRYLRDTPDAADNPFEENWRAMYRIMLLDALRRHEAWAIHGGDAVVMVHSSGDTLSQRQKAVDAFLRRLNNYLIRFLMWYNTKEQRHRFREGQKTLPDAVKSVVGDRLDQMITLDLIAVAPGKQGRGYGSTLVKLSRTKYAFHIAADAQARATYLLSSNLESTEFFKSLGFSTISEVTLGEDNPTWDKASIIIQVMVREPRAPSIDAPSPSTPCSVTKD
ncbi:hypothetical protein B0H21DRAFT_723642 [Amylocystis lapponica]|nr:hypothetical protein B0H21DRAFT_723642 [Amylocystis lapponica]